MRNYLIYGILASAALFAQPASASDVVAGNCVSVTAPHGCLFSGNINTNSVPLNVNGYVNAQNAYNTFNDSHSSATPDISLNVIAASDDLTFSGLGSTTGTGSSGTWALSGFLVNFVAVKASDYFVLYQLTTPASTGSWNTLDIPYKNNPHDISHLVFFGSPREGAVPEPATWAMMLLGFGAMGMSLRRRRIAKSFQTA